MGAPNHRLIMDLSGVSMDTASMSSPEQISAAVSKALPGVARVRFATLIDQPTPTVRVTFDLAISTKVVPAVRIQDGAIAVAFNAEFAEPVAVGSEPAAVTASGATDAYSQYASAMQAQNPETPKKDEVWGARKGSAAELKGLVNGIKPLVTSSALSVPAIEPVLTSPLPAVKENAGEKVEAAANQTEVVETKQTASGNQPLLRDTTPDTAISTAAAASASANAAAAETVEAGADTASSAAAVAPAVRAPQTKVAAKAAAPVVVSSTAESTTYSATSDAAAQLAEAEEAAARAAAAQRLAAQKAAIQQAALLAAAAKSHGGLTRAAAAVPKIAAVTPAPQAAPEMIAAPEAEATVASSAGDDPAESPKIKARRLFNSAVKAHQSGNIDQAIADYKAALTLDNELGDAYSNLGLAYNQQHNFNDALVQFRKALAIHPSDAITYNGIGAALRAQKDVLGAIKNWETAIKISPKLAVAHYNLGTAFEYQGDMDRAMVSYKAATQNDPRLGEAYYRMGLIMWKKNKTEDAKENFRLALKVQPNADFSQDARTRLAMTPKAK